jgi:hypothetical protein
LSHPGSRASPPARSESNRVVLGCADSDFSVVRQALCTETHNATDMQISEAAGGAPAPGAEPCRFPKLEECAHFHYERVQLPKLTVTLQTNIEQSLHSQHGEFPGYGGWRGLSVRGCSQRRRRHRVVHGAGDVGRRVLAAAEELRELQDARRPTPPVHLRQEDLPAARPVGPVSRRRGPRGEAEGLLGAVQRHRGQLGELRPRPELAADGQQGPPPPGAERGEPLDQHPGGGGGVQRPPVRLPGSRPPNFVVARLKKSRFRPATSSTWRWGT